MPVKWYWAHDGKKFIEFENPQERTAFNLIQSEVERTLTDSGNTCHILVNVQKCEKDCKVATNIDPLVATKIDPPILIF